MGKFANFQVDEHIAAQQAVVEHQIDKKMVFLEGEPLLPCLEKKAFSEFQQEMFDLADDGEFQVGFGISGLFIQPEKFQNIRVFEQVLRLADDLPPAGQFPDAFLVPAQSQPLKQSGVELAFHLPQGPVLLRGFDLIEIPFIGIFDAQQKDIV